MLQLLQLLQRQTTQDVAQTGGGGETPVMTLLHLEWVEWVCCPWHDATLLYHSTREEECVGVSCEYQIFRKNWAFQEG